MVVRAEELHDLAGPGDGPYRQLVAARELLARTGSELMAEKRRRSAWKRLASKLRRERNSSRVDLALRQRELGNRVSVVRELLEVGAQLRAAAVSSVPVAYGDRRLAAWDRLAEETSEEVSP